MPTVTTSRLIRLLLLVLLVGSVNGLSRVTLPLFAASVGAQPWQIGITGALGYFGMLTLSLPMGLLIDRYGGRRMFVTGACAAAGLYLVLAQTASPWPVIGVAAVLGLVLPFRNIPVHTEFLSMLPQLSPSKAGWNRAANMSGMFLLGPALAAAVIAAAGFSMVMVIASAALILGVLAGAGALSRPAAQARDVNQAFGTRLRGQLGLLREDIGLRRTISVDFLFQMAAAYFVVFGVTAAVRHFGMTQQAAVGLVTVQGLTYVLMLIAGGAMTARLGNARSYLLALSLMGVQAALFAFGTGPRALWVAAPIMGLATGIQGLLSTLRFASLMQQHGRGRIAGLSSMGPPAGGLLGGLGGGLLSQQFGLQSGFVVLTVAFVLAAIAAWRTPEGW